ncbi:MAG: MFS transporter [Cyanobacteriota bacterium]|jgi:MFS transporter, FHS family, glucose/mannose:H+ symporter|nr:MFS transporter [Cyanobacteriota bacterium]
MTNPSNHRAEQALLQTVGVMQGVALVTFPAISTVLTSPSGYALSSRSYGLIFLPQVVAAIAASFLGAQLSRTWGSKRVLLLGLLANALSMAVLLSTTFVVHQPQLTLPLLMLATALMGFGFGGVVPVLNTFIAAFQPDRVDEAILMLNALLGLGTALAPALAAVVVGPGVWWLLPMIVFAAALLLLYGCSQQPLRLSRDPSSVVSKDQRGARSSGLLVLFVAVAVLYGLVETLNGNWSVLLMSNPVGAPTQVASLALTLFWAMVTVGRLLFSRLASLFPPRVLLPGLPVFLAVVLFGISRVSSGDTGGALVLFALSGLGCSAMLPLIISFGQKQLATLGEAVAGLLIAAYQLGYGLAAFGGGAVQQQWRLPIPSLFGMGAFVALVLGLLSCLIVVPKRSFPHPHP